MSFQSRFKCLEIISYVTLDWNTDSNFSNNVKFFFKIPPFPVDFEIVEKIIKISTADGKDCPISIMLIVLMIQIAYSSKAF